MSPITIMLAREHLDTHGDGTAIVISGDGPREIPATIKKFGTALCVELKLDQSPEASTKGKHNNRAFRGNTVPVPADVRGRLKHMPYPDLVAFAKRIGSKANHLANLGDTVTTDLLQAISDGFAELDAEQKPAQLGLSDLPPLNN